MTNTKFRKRALLSSVAMLLVALVALGSATFAWFSTTSTANAGSMLAKTNKSSSILLAEGNADGTNGADTGVVEWLTNVTFAKHTSTNSSALTPVTTTNGSAWYSTMATGYNDGFKAATDLSEYQNVTASITDGRYAKWTTLFIKSQGASKSVKVTVNASGNADDKAYVRVLLVPITSNTVASKTFDAGENGAKAMIFDDGTKNDVSKTGLWTAANTANNPSDNLVGSFGTGYALGEADADEVYGYDVYVYEEGTDKDCKDVNGGKTSTITFVVEEDT